jgi:hypothetical protein|tara:strand:- start:2588 stop:2875 length:288 start_codon:yes stop_codon:yes gene_type:complete
MKIIEDIYMRLLANPSKIKPEKPKVIKIDYLALYLRNKFDNLDKKIIEDIKISVINYIDTIDIDYLIVKDTLNKIIQSIINEGIIEEINSTILER